MGDFAEKFLHSHDKYKGLEVALILHTFGLIFLISLYRTIKIDPGVVPLVSFNEK